MQFRRKIGYMALGGLLVLVGHVLPGLLIPKASAQAGAETVEEVRTKRLIIEDDLGTVRTALAVSEDAPIGIGRGSASERRLQARPGDC